MANNRREEEDGFGCTHFPCLQVGPFISSNQLKDKSLDRCMQRKHCERPQKLWQAA
jgi:hypothetical protein